MIRNFHSAICVAAIASLLTLGGCGKRLTGGEGRDASVDLKVVGPWEIPTFDPLGSGAQFLRMEVTETLVDASPDGALLPGLATRWTASDDGLQWTFELPADRRFHDGTAVTSEAVLLCLRRSQVAPGILSLAPIDKLTAQGQTVQVKLNKRYSLLPALLAHASTQILAPASFNAGGEVERIIGTGPFRVTYFEPPQYFRVAAFESWKGPNPIKSASYLSVSRSETRSLMVEGGQADIVFNLDPASLTRLRKRKDLTVKAITIPRTIGLKLNAGLPCFSDVRTRRAISLAINRAGIAKAILRDPEMAATQLLPPVLSEWHQKDLAALQYDLAKARQLLAEAGWKSNEGGTTLQLNGACSELELRAFPDRPELPIMAAVIQEEMRQLGLHVRVNVGNSGDIPSGHRDGSLAMGLIARNYGVTPDPTGTLLTDFGPKGGDWGAMGWSNRRIDEALRAVAAMDAKDQERPLLMDEVVEILQEELPIIPVVWYRQTATLGPRLRDIPMDPFERSYRLTGITFKEQSQR